MNNAHDDARVTSANGHLAMRAFGVGIEDVNLSYGDNHVLKDVNLDIKPGEFFAFLGPSGCGKTTLLRLIAGFAVANTGRVLVGGKDISALPPWKRDVGMVFQSYALWPHMTVAQNVAFGLEERRLPSDEVKARVATALDLVGLRDFPGRRPSQLSGGQQQRVALARTIVVEPKVLLLDEPLSNLDAKLRVQVRRELRDMQQRLGLTTIFVTHDQEEANTVCDRVAVMNEGIVQQIGTPQELYERPRNLFVANFLGSANIIAGHVIGDNPSRMFEIDGGLKVPVPAEAAIASGARMIFRPQDAAILLPNESLPAGAVSVDVVIADREFLGSLVRYGVRLGNTRVLVDAPFRSGDTVLEAGDQIRIAIFTRSLRWLAE
jgi:iron(III) transport system ATP-binding protein